MMRYFTILAALLTLSSGCAHERYGYVRKGVDRPNDVGLTSALNASLNIHNRSLVIITADWCPACKEVDWFWHHHRVNGEVYLVDEKLMNPEERALHQSHPFVGAVPTCFVFRERELTYAAAGAEECTSKAFEHMHAEGT